MSVSLDVNLLPVGRSAWRDYPELLSLFAGEAPRRAARGREHDRLVLYLAMQGNAPLPPAQQERALADLAAVYYRTPGSTTAALRSVAEALNAWLLERNLQLGGSRQGTAYLAQAALRNEQVALAHSGPIHSYLITSTQTQHYYRADMQDRGLGQGKVPPIQYYLGQIQSGDTLLLAAYPDPAWEIADLSKLHGQGPESLRRRLFHAGLSDLNAVLLQARTGKGRFFIHQAQPAALPVRPLAQSAPPAAMGEDDAALPVSTPPTVVPPRVAPPWPFEGAEAAAALASDGRAGAPLEATPPPSAPSFASQDEPGSSPGAAHEAAFDLSSGAPEDAVQGMPDASHADTFDVSSAPLQAVGETAADAEHAPAFDSGAAVASQAPSDEADGAAGSAPALDGSPAAFPAAAAQMSGPGAPSSEALDAGPHDMDAAMETSVVPAVTPARRAAGRAGAGAAALGRRLGRGLTDLWARFAPGDLFSSLPSSMMAFAALITPLIIVIIATMVYLRLGRDVQYDTLLAQAQAMAVRGLEQKEVQPRRADLETALDLLARTEAMRTPSLELADLRRRVQDALDEMDMVQRVDYQPAIINGLPLEVDVVRMVLVDDSLYMLDGASGRVLRAVDTGQGLALDDAFVCGANAAGMIPVGPLVDIAAWSTGFSPSADLVGIDAAGAVIYCSTNDAPQTALLTRSPVPEAWGAMSHFVVDDGDTYALDKASKGLWIYRRSNFELEPDAFFNGVAPVVDDVVDLANNMDDAYLLHQDGSLTLCTYSGFKNSPTACSAVRYTDARPGRERLPFVPLSPFAQVQSTLPPDPAIFFLETLQPNIDHFSLHNLVFQGQFIPKKALPVSRPAGAFLVDNRGRILYLAFGSQVYYGIMP